MKLVRMRGPQGPAWGELVGEAVHWLDGGFAMGFRRTGARAVYDADALLAPFESGKIIGVAANYPAHAVEMGKPLPDEPRIFLKPASAVVGPGEPIRIPPGTTRVDPEGELGIVIGRTLSRATPETARAGILGFTCVNDVTARDFQKKDGIFGRAKGFDTFCPVGPWIDTDLDGTDLEVSTWVNGERRAVGRTSEMHFDIPTLLAFISSVMTLHPGDIIATGTPPGVAPLNAGDHVEVRIEGLGALANPVVDRDDRR
jgi:2-keto-4-pentenoate hydratase/2-oxohepta-3-ene-1,7-dioic acid hydratase in catechol pathway